MEKSEGSGRRLRIGIVAGEASGDLLGAHLIKAVRQKVAEVDFIGIAGPKMQAAGAQTLVPMEKLAVNGYVEVLRHFREILGIRRAVAEYFTQNPPDLFIGVDAPDFNFRLEERLKAKGIPTMHYVGPSIWAWRGERIRQIGRSVDRVLVVFPFEPPIYERAGIPVTYVGHPLGDALPLNPDRMGARQQLRLPKEALVVAMLPGSRQSEVRRMGEMFVRTAQLILRSRLNTRFLVPLISKETRKIFEEVLAGCEAYDLPLTVLFGHAQDALTAADVALVASGTATLETALLKRPMVITYKVSSLTWKLAKRKAYLPYVGLPNVLAGKFVVPELLQEDATPQNLAQALLNLVDDRGVQERLEKQFAGMHHALRQGSGEKLAAAILRQLNWYDKAIEGQRLAESGA